MRGFISSFTRGIVPAVVLPLLLCSRLAAAEDPLPADALPSDPPIAVVNVAGVERLLDDVDYLFGTADRADLTEIVSSLLGGVNDLRGLERGKPFGVLVFLEPGLVPRPVPVAFLPVADAVALSKTVEVGPVVVKKTGEGRYEIIGRRRTLYAVMSHGYAFVADSETPLDREFYDPAERHQALSARYDVAAEVRPENVPPGMRELFVSLLRNNAETELQRRDGESKAAHAVRKAQGRSNLKFVERLLTETRAVTLGLDASRKNRVAVAELSIDATPESAHAALLRDMASQPSRFAPLLANPVPLSLSASTRLDEDGKKVLTELFNLAATETAKALTRLDRGTMPATDGEPKAAATVADEALAGRVFDPLKETVAAGHLDLFAQFRGDQQQKFLLVGGMKLLGAAGMESAVRQIVERVKAGPDAGDFDVTFDAAEASGITLHRLTGNQVREQDQRLYGSDFAAYVGFGRDTVWFTVGGDRAVPELADVIEEVRDAPPADRADPAAPFRLSVTAATWVGLDPADPNTDLARSAFEKGGDTLRIDFRPTDDGARLRVELEEGFLRLLGLGVAKRYDASQR